MNNECLESTSRALNILEWGIVSRLFAATADWFVVVIRVFHKGYLTVIHETIDRQVAIRPEQLIKLVSGLLFGLQPDPDNPLPPGPWDPLIRQVFGLTARHAHVFAEPGGFVQRSGRFVDRVALNPQPLPPRFAVVVALAEAAVSRAELVADVGAASGHNRAGGRYMSELLENWCGTPPRKFPWPGPGPRPDWAGTAVGPLDHLLMAATFDAMLQAGVGEELAGGIRAGQRKLLDAAMDGLGAGF